MLSCLSQYVPYLKFSHVSDHIHVIIIIDLEWGDASLKLISMILFDINCIPLNQNRIFTAEEEVFAIWWAIQALEKVDVKLKWLLHNSTFQVPNLQIILSHK